MPKYQQPEGHIYESIEQAWRQQGERGAVAAIIVKYAKENVPVFMVMPFKIGDG